MQDGRDNRGDLAASVGSMASAMPSTTKSLMPSLVVAEALGEENNRRLLVSFSQNTSRGISPPSEAVTVNHRCPSLGGWDVRAADHRRR